MKISWPNSCYSLIVKDVKIFDSPVIENNFSFQGVFSGLTVTFMMERRIGYYVFHVFLPCTFVVMLSFLSFWMSPEDVGKLIFWFLDDYALE